MDNLVRLWNPRSNNQLRRYWIRFEDRIVIGGERPEQAGVLMLLPAGVDGLRAHLWVTGAEFEQTVARGNDIEVRINGLELHVDVKAVAAEAVLIAFGIPRGAIVGVTLEAGAELQAQAMGLAIDCARPYQGTRAYATGLRQTRS